MLLRVVACTAILLCVVQLVSAQQRFSTGTVPPARFSDPERSKKLAAAFPEIDKLFKSFVERAQMPGAAMGVIIDGELVWIQTAGVRDTKSKTPVTPDTVFRIASMTKSFTAMSILKLRDEGKLSLEDPVARYVPALATLPYPTKDSPVLTIRLLLSHSEGFPEDNPWGDRQLAQSDETIRNWMKAGIPFSTVPGTAYEYSNYGFAILGQVVAKASGRPYTDYVRDNILKPLGMNSTTFEKTSVSPEQMAIGYRWENEQFVEEPILAHGSFGSMGGLWTTTRDLAKYVAFLMSAFPPRDDADNGPIKRSSAREMQQFARLPASSVVRGNVDSPLQLALSGYGFGLGVSQDCRFAYVVGHGGGLPGYGSLMRWLPEYGVGLIAMSNLTYGGFNGLFNDSLSALYRTGALRPRTVVPSQALLDAQRDISQLIIKWDDSLANRVAADNLFLDVAADVRKGRWAALAEQHGTCRPATTIEAENALRGRWRMSCDRGWLDVQITLAPTSVPKVQAIGITPVLPPDIEMQRMADNVTKLFSGWDPKAVELLVAPGVDVEKMRRQVTALGAWGTCRLGETLGGNGTRTSTFRLNCDGGPVALRMNVDASSHLITALDLVPLREQRCVP